MTEGDVLLALLLIAGFATLGILITLGNVRQTRAIREVGEVLLGWAIRHIQLSRAVAAASIRVENPEVWFRETLARVQLPGPGAVIRIRNPSLLRRGEGWLLFQYADDGSSGLVLLHRPELDPRGLERGSSFASPVLPSGFLRRARSMELSPLTMGETFDLELAAAWEKLFPGDPPPERLRLWVGRPDRGGEKA